MRKSLNIISNKKNFHIDTSEQDLKQSRSKSAMLYSAGSNGNGLAPEDDGDDVYNVGNNSKKKEEESKATEGTTGTQDKTKTDTPALTYNMNVYIQNLLNQLGRPESVTFDTSTGKFSNEAIANEISGSALSVDLATVAASWDPRLYRVDGYVSSNNFIVPFATDTASSAYYDHLFTIESEIIKLQPNKKTDSDTKSTTSGLNGNSNNADYSTNGNVAAADKIAPNKTEVNSLQADPDMFGTASLMNPYCVTRLVGGLTGTKENFSTHMYDIRDKKRFYDNSGDLSYYDKESGSYINETNGVVLELDDVTSISNPTVTNIIRWSNKDKWGRTPFSYQDFVFCKYFNIIPNNHLIVFRKYAAPTYDNLNFPNMLEENGMKPTNLSVAPIATVVSYFGGDSGNKLNDFLKFTTGTKWKTIEADVHKVSGDTGSNPRAVVDKLFENGGTFGTITSKSNPIAGFLSKAGGITGDLFSMGKLVGLLDPDGYSGHNQDAWYNLTQANMDARESLYSNKVVGPINRVQSTLARDAGIEFELSFNLVCEYTARPIGGINVKAAMLDILSNCMEMASVEAVFWGGGYRFMIKPHMYPFKRDGKTNRMMNDLYAGRIFGTDGAIADGLRGLAEFGKNEQGEFSWSNVTSRLGSILSQTVGAIGNMLSSITSSLFGETSNLKLWIDAGTNALSSEEDLKKGSEKLKSLTTNLNKMWHDRVIQETTMPNIEGMKAILSGESVGNWWLSVGNPLNPMISVGNLICKKMSVEWGEELGPDDFPILMKVTYTIEHAMPRDKAAIQSMFNRGAGKIYKLPDYIKAVSDYESKIDPFTGPGKNLYDRTDKKSFYVPKFINAGKLMAEGGNNSTYDQGASGYQVYKITEGKALAMTGNAKTTMIAKFSPADPQIASPLSKSIFLNDTNNIALYRGNCFTRKINDN